jgi:hypothetical protein
MLALCRLVHVVFVVVYADAGNWGPDGDMGWDVDLNMSPRKQPTQ